MLLMSRSSGASELAEPSLAMVANVLGGELAAPSVELDALAQIEGPGAAAVRDLPALSQHGGEVARLGVAREEVLEHGLEDHVLGPDVQVREPALVAESGHRHRQGALGLGGLPFGRNHRPEGERRDG